MRDLATSWKAKRPGGYDPLHATRLFPGSGHYGIPQMRPCHVIPDELVPYTEARRLVRRGRSAPSSSAVHFFLEDYRFEAAWSTPERVEAYCDGAAAVLSPDFSLYTDHPLALQLHNVYRSKYLAARWQAAGLEVIHTAQWSDERSFAFAFDGAPVGGVHCVSTVGVLHPSQRAHCVLEAFTRGMGELVARCKPDVLLCYGELPPEGTIPAGLEVRCYQPWQARLRNLKTKET